MTTIREVARLAGVSYATVSHVINDTRFVAPGTRERVLAAMDDLHYRPNAIARSLRRGKTNTFGLVLPDSANPFFAEISRSIEEGAFKTGNSVILCNTGDDLQREMFYVDALAKRQVDGIIFVAAGDRADSIHFLVNQEVPVVMIDRDLPDANVDAVLIDNCQGGYLAAKHLLGLGHKRIGIIAGPANISAGAERIAGCRQALEEAGIPYDETLITRGDYHPRSGMEATRSLLEMENHPTAIFALNDLMALGALRAAAEAGLAVPGDLAIIGFGDIELARFTNPPLSTIAHPKNEAAMQAVNLLVERIREPGKPPSRLKLSPELIIRESTHMKEK